jgi:hypothetical protein
VWRCVKSRSGAFKHLLVYLFDFVGRYDPAVEHAGLIDATLFGHRPNNRDSVTGSFPPPALGECCHGGLARDGCRAT